MVRCFIGVLLEGELKNYVNKIQDELKKLPIDCKFVEKENLHICLSFLGEIDENKIKNISEVMGNLCKDFFGFEVESNGIKLIPNEKYVRVIVLDIVDKTGCLNLLSKKIVESVGGDAKPPHITLCRVRSVGNKQSFVDDVKKTNTINKPIQIKSVYLLKSELSKHGPTYTVLHESKLLYH